MHKKWVKLDPDLNKKKKKWDPVRFKWEPDPDPNKREKYRSCFRFRWKVGTARTGSQSKSNHRGSPTLFKTVWYIYVYNLVGAGSLGRRVVEGVHSLRSSGVQPGCWSDLVGSLALSFPTTFRMIVKSLSPYFKETVSRFLKTFYCWRINPK